MAEAVAEKTKIKDDEFDIHGDLAVSESDDKSFVVLYDSSKEDSQLAPISTLESGGNPAGAGAVEAPSLEDLDESHAMSPATDVHPEDAYIDDILSSDDIDTFDAPPAMPVSDEAPVKPAMEDDDGPIALSNEELDGILEMGPTTEEEFHPDFPVEHHETTPSTSSADGEPRRLAGQVAAPVMAEEGAAAPVLAEPAHFDDEELPIALSDEDLDEILLEEEAAPVSAPPRAASAKEAAVTPQMAPAPVPMDHAADLPDDEEPIALSDDELDHILADAEAGHSHDAPELLPETGEDELLTLDEDPQITMIDDGAGPLDGSPTHSAEQNASGFFDSDEDEPITLSDEELDGILSSAPEEEALKQSDEVALPQGDTAPMAAAAEIEDDEPIALSNEELDGILMDADEPQEGVSETPIHDDAAHAGEKGFFDADEDEPIALSADELDGIAATATPEDAPPMPEAPLAELPPEGMDAEGLASPGMDVGGPEGMDAEGTASPGMEGSGPEGIDAGAAIDERYADVDHMDSTPAPEEDDGPIALSPDEMDGIVADAREVTPEAPMMPLSPMDSGAHEPSLAENLDKPATVFEEDLEAATLIHEDEHAAAAAPAPDTEELKSVMTYLDNLLGELPDDVIEKFAQSEYFKMYQKIMDKLGL